MVTVVDRLPQYGDYYDIKCGYSQLKEFGQGVGFKAANLMVFHRVRATRSVLVLSSEKS